MNWLLKNFLRGLLVVVPSALTIYLVYTTFLWIDRLLNLKSPGLGLLILVVGVVVIGALAGNFIVRRFLLLAENLFTRAPIVRIIYAAIKDLLEAFVGKKRRFDRPVAISLTEGSDIRMLGFVTREDLSSFSLPDHVAVSVPFSYTWDGCLMIVPRSRIQPLEADSTTIMAMVMSGGVSQM